MAPTYKGRLMAIAIRDLIENNAATLGVLKTHYGDQDIITDVPACCVEPAQSAHAWSGAPYMQDNTIQVAIILYHTGLDGIRDVQEKADEIMDNIVDFINLRSLPAMWGGDLLGGLVTSGQVISREYGYKVKVDKKMRANRVVWEGFSKTKLVESLPGG